MCALLPLRCCRGRRVPRGRKGHGTAGGSGAWCGPDHLLCHHFLLTHPRHPVKTRKEVMTARKANGAGGFEVLVMAGAPDL